MICPADWTRFPTRWAVGLDHSVWYSSYYLDVIGRLDPKTGKVMEYPFPHSENTIREFFRDSEGRMWYGSPSNNKVGYFYLTGASWRREVRQPLGCPSVFPHSLGRATVDSQEWLSYNESALE